MSHGYMIEWKQERIICNSWSEVVSNIYFGLPDTTIWEWVPGLGWTL